MSFDWFPWYPLAFRQKTFHLTLEEDGAYRRLIDEYMITKKPLPNDPKSLARILGGISAEEYNRIAPRVVMRFFSVRNSKLWNKRCEEELRAQAARQKRNSERGKRGALAKHTKALLKKQSAINGVASSSLLGLSTLQDKEKNLTSFSSENSAARAREEKNAPEIPKTTNGSGKKRGSTFGWKPPTDAELLERYGKRNEEADQ